MSAQHWYWWAEGAALLLAVAAGFAEHRRSRRDRLDDIGWVPWRGIQVMAVFAMLTILILALKMR
jgi:uncharacterized membrane protein